MRVDTGPATSYVDLHHPETESVSHGETVQANRRADPQPQTPAQRTDAAYTAYRDALQHRAEAMKSAPRNMAERTETRKTEDAAVSAAKKALNAAVAAEIRAKIATANERVPSEYQTPASEQIDTYGQAILQRHADDPAARAALGESIGDYKLQRQADDLIPGFYGSATPKEKLEALGLALHGKPPEVVERALADPRVQQWVKDAAAHIGEPYKGVAGGDLPQANEQAIEASKRLNETVHDLPPELATRVIEASMPTIQQVARLNPHGNVAPFTVIYSAMSRLGDSPQAQGLMAQAARAYAENDANWEGALTGPEGAIFGAAGFNNDPRFAMALADQLRAAGKGYLGEQVLDQAAGGINSRLKYDVNSPKVQFDKAHAASVEKDKHLAELLGDAGPLTDPQRVAFIKAYRDDPQNAQVYRAEAAAAKKLAEHLDSNKEALLFAAGRNPEAARQLYDSMRALKDSGQGKTALTLALEIQKDPNSPVAKAFDQFGDFKTDFIAEALPAAAADLLAQNNGDAPKAFDDLKALIDRYKPDWAVSGFSGFKEGMQAVKLAAEGKYDRLNQLATNFDKPMAKGLAAVGIILGAKGGADAASRGDYAEAVNRFAAAGGNSAKLLAGATKGLADAGKLAAYGDSALSFADFSSKLAPGLAIVANATAAASDGGKLFGGDLSYGLSFAGDVLGVLGAAAEHVPPLAPLGFIVQGIGAVLQIAGGLVTGHAEEKAFNAEQSKYLEAAGISDPEARSALAHADREQAQALQALGLTPAQVQDLAADYPDILQSTHSGGLPISNMQDLSQRLGLRGDQLYQLLKAADANVEPGTGIHELLSALSSPAITPMVTSARTRDELIAALEERAQYLSAGTQDGSNADQVRALQQAAQWLRTH